MKAADFDINIINHYFDLLKNLSKQNKEKLITRLRSSMEQDGNNEKNSVTHLFGAFKSNESADEIIKSIRKSRTFKRKIEEFE